MIKWGLFPFFSFLVLLGIETYFPAFNNKNGYRTADWVMNLCGLIMQGLVVPLLGYGISELCLPFLYPSAKGILPLGTVGALTLNLVGIDFLYYWQHRLFHHVPLLKKLHAPHHYSPTLNVWATSRNSIIIHFIFVYLLLNPFLGYLCDTPEAFFVGAMITASLDVFRHSNTTIKIPLLQGILVMPRDHHRHHAADKPSANFGANFIIWDRVFGTADLEKDFPVTYAWKLPPPLLVQLLFPWKG